MPTTDGVDPAASAEAVQLLKTGASAEAAISALTARGVEEAAAKAHVAHLVELKRQAQANDPARALQAVVDEGARREEASKARTAMGCGALLVLGGLLATALAMLGFSAAGKGYQDSSAEAARQTSTAMLASGIGMLGVGALLVVAGVRRRRR